MNEQEIEQLAQAFRSLTPVEMEGLVSMVGADPMEKMLAALDRRDVLKEQAAEENKKREQR